MLQQQKTSVTIVNSKNSPFYECYYL